MKRRQKEKAFKQRFDLILIWKHFPIFAIWKLWFRESENTFRYPRSKSWTYASLARTNNKLALSRINQE